MEREENKLFKYATKELSQDAFICWCINWINYKDHKLYDLGKDMLNAIIFQDTKNESLFPNYEKGEIIEKYNMLNGIIKDSIKEEKKEFEKELKKLDELYNKQNEEISKIIEKINESKKALKSKIDVDKITNVKIVRQFKQMDIVVTINKEFVIIIEDKINTTTNKQLERYSKVMQKVVANEDESDLNLLELDKKKFKSSNIIPVYMKTGRFNFDEKTISFRRITGTEILNILEKYKNKNDIIQDFYICLKDKLSKENDNKYKEIIEKGYLKIGERFEKRYAIYNCFSKYTNNLYASNKHLNQKGYFLFQNTIVGIWTPRLYNFRGWRNVLSEDGETLTEERLELIENSKMTDNDIRYVFIRKRDTFNMKYFEFAGVYSIDTKISTQNKRVWRKYNTKDNKITLNIEKLEKELDTKLKI